MARADIHDIREGEDLELASHGILHTKESKIIEVILSERNLLSLLAKLHIDGSKKTLYNGDVPDGYTLKLVAEDDETHYASESRGAAVGLPGKMSPATEGLVAALRKTLDAYNKNTKVAQLFHEGVADARGA